VRGGQARAEPRPPGASSGYGILRSQVIRAGPIFWQGLVIRRGAFSELALNCRHSGFELEDLFAASVCERNEQRHLGRDGWMEGRVEGAASVTEPRSEPACGKV